MQNAATLPSSVGREVFAELCELLPPPVSDTQEARDTRDAAAMAAVVALHPADAFEALLAVQIVAADAHGRESLRLAVKASREPEVAHRRRAQAIAMMRQMQSVLRTLVSWQASREQADAPAPKIGAPEIEAPEVGAEALEAPRATVAAAAERHVPIHPERAARIPANGGLPERVDVGRAEEVSECGVLSHRTKV